MKPVMHDPQQDRLDLPIYGYLRSVFAASVHSQLPKLVNNQNLKTSNHTCFGLLAGPLKREESTTLSSEFSEEIAYGVVSTWVSKLLEVHDEHGEICPIDIAGEEIIKNISDNMRYYKEINFAELIKAALIEFSSNPLGLALPRNHTINQKTIIGALKILA